MILNTKIDPTHEDLSRDLQKSEIHSISSLGKVLE